MVSNIEFFLTGIFASATGIYAYARMKGFNLLALGEILKALAEYQELREELKGAMGNITIGEIGEVIGEAYDASIGGYTQAEVEKIAKKLIEVAASK